MGVIENKECSIEEKMNHTIGFLNGVFSYFDQPKLHYNPEIQTIEWDLDNMLVFKLERSHNHIPLQFWVTNGDLRVDVDRSIETIEWDFYEIKNKRGDVFSWLNFVLTNYALVEHYKEYATKIKFFDNEGYYLDKIDFYYLNYFHHVWAYYLKTPICWICFPVYSANK